MAADQQHRSQFVTAAGIKATMPKIVLTQVVPGAGFAKRVVTLKRDVDGNEKEMK